MNVRTVSAFSVSIAMFSRMKSCTTVLVVRVGRDSCRLKVRGKGKGAWKLWLRMVNDEGTKAEIGLARVYEHLLAAFRGRLMHSQGADLER